MAKNLTPSNVFERDPRMECWSVYGLGSIGLGWKKWSGLVERIWSPLLKEGDEHEPETIFA